MKSQRERNSGPSPAMRRVAAVLVLFLGAVLAASAQDFTLRVVDQADGLLPIGYRWLLQEDTTYDIKAGEPASLSLGFHRSYSPPVATGSQGGGEATISVPDAAKRYFLSVLPNGGYTMSGAAVPANLAAGAVITVKVHQHPVPTAQIAVRVFHDNAPINNVEDQPEEQGLAGFRITLEDAGGRYGITAGAMMMDAFGNPLGTVYGQDGNVVTMGSGVVYTDANGDALIQNLAPGKYGVSVVPPVGERWIQTSTIEGTKIVDAWVKPNEPPFFVEFGPPGVHAFFGFVQETREADSPDFFTGSASITGQVVFLHNSRPPDFTFWPNYPVPGAWVGLNSAPAGTGVGVYAAPTDEDGVFTISGIPAGTYELAVWDENLDVIFYTREVTVADGELLDLGPPPAGQGPVMVFNWFGRTEHYVFEDKDEDGFRDPDEIGIPEQAINLRFRDGTIYQSFPTDGEGYVPFDEVFPFFNWLVAEVDYTKYKATGVTVTVDAGGEVDGDVLAPQPQYETDPDTGFATSTPLLNPNTDDNLSRTETGPVLTQAFQVFLGQTNRFEWGKRLYEPGENGGISGIVYYASTRAENDPALAAGDPWEPGIPRVQVNLYQGAKFSTLDTAKDDLNDNDIIDNEDDYAILDLNGSGAIELSDVDNYPFGWSVGGARGPEDQDGNTLTPAEEFSQGDAWRITWSDSWDDNLPTGAQPYNANGPGFEDLDAFDGMRNFNQVRPGVFDGGYAFNDIPSGVYIVEVKLPPGYELVEEEDKNVDFGDAYQGVSEPVNGNPAMPMLGGLDDNATPAQDSLDKRPIAVGDLRQVPEFLSLFPDEEEPAPFALQWRHRPDRKQVILSDGMNAAADFFLYTEVPVAGHIVGFVLDDLSNEFDPNAPNFGEKYSPPWLPITVRDWEGNVVYTTSTDQYGAYNALIPSTYTANVPDPSGYSPNMLTVVINDASVEGHPANPQYSQFSYTFQYMPGTTTYLDTPVVPIAAFAGPVSPTIPGQPPVPGMFPVDVEFENHTPVIREVSWLDGGLQNGVESGPYVPSVAGGPNTRRIRIYSMGTAVQVPNPDYDGTNLALRTSPRDYGFGTRGVGQGAGQVTLDGKLLNINSWNANQIVATLPANATTGQLVVTRSNGRASVLGVTVTVGPLVDGFDPATDSPIPRKVVRVGTGQDDDFATIQAAIDDPTTEPGDLVLVAPGTYRELVIMHKPVRLQGWGAGATFINAVQVPSEKINDWRTHASELWAAGAFDLLPAQAPDFLGLEPILAPVEGAAISVYARNANRSGGGFGPDRPVVGQPVVFNRARIDGFTLEGASEGGGVFVNGYGRYLDVSNNRIRQNAGNQGGGVVVGHPALVVQTPAGLEYQDAHNDHIRVHHNQIVTNGGLSGAGGGMSLYTGADFYEVTDNLIAGNFTSGDGGGIGHQGRSEGGVIARNRILFNHSFDQMTTVSGGGIFLGGGAPLELGGQSEGSGSVTASANLIQGNMAGAGDGGGIKVLWTLAGDQIIILNNFIVNNVAGLAGGGIALQEAANVDIDHNTIAHNDSTATAGVAFETFNQSTPQPAGVAVRVTAGEAFTAPTLTSNIIWENRSFFWQIVSETSFGLQEYDASWDLGVLPASAGTLPVGNNKVTGGSPPNPSFEAAYFNGPRNQVIIWPESIPQTMPAFDEGGNFIDVRFGPLTAGGSDYHLSNSLVAGGTQGEMDIDGDTTDTNGTRYVGADRRTNSTNIAPVAVGDSYTLVAGLIGLLTVGSDNGVLANDYDPDGQALSVVTPALTQPSQGVVLLSSNGGFIYTPASFTFEGTVSFTYLLTDGNRRSVGTVTINVVRPRTNNAPAPTAVPILTNLNTPGTTQVLPNDPDASDTHTYAIIEQGDFGSATVTPGGLVSYTPNSGFAGNDNLIVQVTDQGGASGTVTVSVTVSLNLAASQNLQVQLPPDKDGLDTDGDGDPDNDHIYVLLGAGDGFTTMADGYQQYIFSFRNLSHLLPAVTPSDPNVRSIPLDKVMNQGMLGAEFPAPTLKIKEGQKLYLNLANVGMALRPDLFDPHTVHWHGFPQAAPVFDGVPDASLSINMMANYTFFYDVVFPGTYMYHCHVEATEHMQMGMLGNLFVTPKQDNLLDPLLTPTPPAWITNSSTGALYKGFAYNDGDGTTGYDVDSPIQIAGFDPAFHDASLTVQPLPFALMKDGYPMLNGRGYPDTVAQGSLIPPQANTYLSAQVAMDGIDPNGYFFNIEELSMGGMAAMMPADVDGAYDGLELVFSSGELAGTVRRILSYNAATKQVTLAEQLTLNGAPAAPDPMDKVEIGKASQKVSSRITATVGQKILLRISSLDVTRYYTLASALPMKIVGLNARLLRGPDPDLDPMTGLNGPLAGANLYYSTNSVTLGGGEAVDAIIDTTGVQPGTYLLYTSNLNYLSNNQEDFGGMMTEIVIN